VCIAGNDFVAHALKDGIETRPRRGSAVDVIFNIPIDNSEGSGEGLVANSQY
jgi:hypothetical protein